MLSTVYMLYILHVRLSQK